MTDTKHPSGAPWRNFYGRFRGKTLRPNQKDHLDSDLDALSPGAVSWEDNPDRKPLDTNALFDGKPIWLEIGFGGGEHLVHQAQQNPHVGIIGCEPFINGITILLRSEEHTSELQSPVPISYAVFCLKKKKKKHKIKHQIKRQVHTTYT